MGVGVRVQGLGFGVWGVGFRVLSSGYRVFRVFGVFSSSWLQPSCFCVLLIRHVLPGL